MAIEIKAKAARAGWQGRRRIAYVVTYPAGPASRGCACGAAAATFWWPLVTTDSQLVSVVASPACNNVVGRGMMKTAQQ
jgi:hypothetical protein